jgi:hypothetical protein
LVLVILAVIWAAVLLPPYLQNRSESRPADSISTFRNQLSVLERRSTMITPAAPRLSAPVSPALVRRPVSTQAQRARLARMEANRRRRDILVTLLAAAGLTLVLGLVMAPVLLLHLVIDALLVAYVALLVRQRRIAEERSVKVRYLSTAATARRAAPMAATSQPSPQLALRRSAGG